MRKLFLYVVSLVAAVPCLSQYRNPLDDLDDSETVKAMKSHVEYIASPARAGRAAGSNGEREVAEYVYDVLESYGVEMLGGFDGEAFSVPTEGGDTLRSRNIAGVVQGYDPDLRDHYIVIGARLDNLGVNDMTVDGEQVRQVYCGANGNASGLAVMMELARMISTNQIMFRRSVAFVAFGGSRRGFAGAWQFANGRMKGSIDAMVNLDMLGSNGDFQAYTASNPDMDSVLGSMTSHLLPVLPDIKTEAPYPSDNMAFYAAEVPSVFFSTGAYPEHDTPRDVPAILEFRSMEAELEYLYDFTMAIANIDHAPSFRSDYGTASDERTYSFSDCDTKPTFMGHYDPRWFISHWVYQYLKYPEEAVKEGLQGRVSVRFTVEKDGTVDEVVVTHGVAPSLDAAAVKVVQASPKWKPAKVGGKAVRCYIEVPIYFKLQKGATFGIKKMK